MARVEKKYRNLTKEQVERGVIFSSQIFLKNGDAWKEHEVFGSDPERDIKIDRLMNDSFFSDIAKHNIIRR